MDQNVTEMHAIVHGRVQGVGFRATVRHYALELGLKGSVCNLPDGTVEIYAQGPKTNLDKLLNRLKQNSGLGQVESVKTEFGDPARPFEHFQIVYSHY